MSRRRAHWSDGFYRSGMMEARYQQGLRARRERARDHGQHKRDRELLLKVLYEGPIFVPRVLGPAQRLINKGLIKAVDEFFPRTGLCRYRLVPNWEGRSLPEGAKRALEIDDACPADPLGPHEPGPGLPGEEGDVVGRGRDRLPERQRARPGYAPAQGRDG